MTGKELMTVLGTIGPAYYEEAEEGMIMPRKGIKRPILIAAIVALTALLVGCAVVYALRLQDMSIGKETYTQSFDDQGKAIEPTEKIRDIITLFGHSGDPIQQAMTQWYQFLETYDPDGALMDNVPDDPEIANQYEFTYGCYTQEMADELVKIAQDHDLKLLEEWIPFQQWQSHIFLEETGIGSFLLPDSGGEVSSLAGMLYPPYNFDMDFELSVDGLDGRLWVNVQYARKDYLPNRVPGGVDLSLYEQWDHTAGDGTKLLLALNSKGHGYIIAQLDNAMLIYSVDGNFSSSAYPSADQVLTKEQLERVAELFDYSIKPQVPDRAAVVKRLEAAQAEYDAAHTYVPETFGSFSELLKARYTVPNDLSQYTFYDLTGDGVEELLIDLTGKGAIDEWLTIQDGEVLSVWGNDVYICEGRVLEHYYEDPERPERYRYHRFTKAEGDPGLLDTSSETSGETILFLEYLDGVWTKAADMHAEEKIEITEAEAQEILGAYPRIRLDWRSVMDYPLSETQTLREYLEETDVRVSEEELLEIYRDHLAEDNHYTHYRLLDINGDGVQDLLLKGEDNAFTGVTDHYWIALTYRYGRIVGLTMDFYLCEDGVLECVETRYSGGLGVEKNGHTFLMCDGLDTRTLDFVVYNKSTAGWQTDWWDEEPISAEEANAILEKYPRIDQGMVPIEELIG